MKKIFVSLTLILILCLALGSSSAHSFEEITVGMDQSDVAAFLQEYTITDQTDYYLAYSDQESRIQINFRNGKAMKVRLWMDGLKDSDLDLFYPDWNLSENELLGTLKKAYSAFFSPAARAARRDFLRLALFWWITTTLTALSRAEHSLRRSSSTAALSSEAAAARNVFSSVARAFLWDLFLMRAFSLLRCVFTADLRTYVLGMGVTFRFSSMFQIE